MGHTIRRESGFKKTAFSCTNDAVYLNGIHYHRFRNCLQRIMDSTGHKERFRISYGTPLILASADFCLFDIQT